MHAYCDRQGHPENSVIFLYDGEIQTACGLAAGTLSASLGLLQGRLHWLVLSLQEGASGRRTHQTT